MSQEEETDQEAEIDWPDEGADEDGGTSVRQPRNPKYPPLVGAASAKVEE